MVIVKNLENFNTLFFPFQLHLASTFEIFAFDGSKKDSWWRFLTGSSASKRHIGIQGNYNEELAREAFADIEKIGAEPLHIGLRVAMRSYAKRVKVGGERFQPI